MANTRNSSRRGGARRSNTTREQPTRAQEHNSETDTPPVQTNGGRLAEDRADAPAPAVVDATTLQAIRIIVAEAMGGLATPARPSTTAVEAPLMTVEGSANPTL